MWRAQPSLSGATCPAGSKTSCCESFVIFWQSFLSFSFCTLLSLTAFSFHPPITLSTPATWVLSWCFSFLISAFLRPSPVFQSIPSALYPCIVSNISSSLPTTASCSFSSALPRYFCPSHPYSQPWLLPSPSLLFSVISSKHKSLLFIFSASPPHPLCIL